MRKVLTFGAGGDFEREYGVFFSRHGFELVKYKKKGGLHGLQEAPILLVMGGRTGPHDETGLGTILTADRRLPIIFLSDGGARPSQKLLKIMVRAKYNLPMDFMKKDLLVALKGCAEILELRGRVDRLQGELRAKGNELAYVLDVGKALASSFDLPKVLTRIMERMRALVGAESWSVMLAREMDGELVLEAARGGVGGLKKRRVRIGEGIAGWAAETKEPKLVAEAVRDRHYSKAVDNVGVKSVRSVMAVPIITKNKLLGVMELINKDAPIGFGQDDLQLVRRMLDQTAIAIERAEMYQKMADLVITDDLTKLFNLRYLDRTLEVEIERAMRYNLSMSLIFMDIDYFKKVNDHYGHLVGSKLLVEVSQLLLKGLRRVDIVARYGGDEFVIVLPQTDVEAARMIAERLRKSIEKHVFLKSVGLALRLTASFGIASYPDHASNKEDLLRLADEAMYRVKYQTRNSVYVVGA